MHCEISHRASSLYGPVFSRYTPAMNQATQRIREYIEPVRLPDGVVRRALLEGLPLLVFARNPEWLVPSREECVALWDKYAMPENIRAHSNIVASFATALAEKAVEAGCDVHVPSVLACGLLHDLGKLYSIKNGGSHGQIGGAWVMNETRNPHIAQGVIQHVRWSWRVDAEVDAWMLSFCIIYADKRVMHDAVVTPEERYRDLLDRYGVTDVAKERIGRSHQQGLEIEAALSRRLRIPLHEYTFDSGRLVKRA